MAEWAEWIALLLLAGCAIWLIRRVRDLAEWQALSRRDLARRLTALEESLEATRNGLAGAADRRLAPLSVQSLETLTVGQLLADRPEYGGLLIWLGLTPDRLGPNAFSLLLPEAAHRAGQDWDRLRRLMLDGAGSSADLIRIEAAPPAHVRARTRSRR